ncbi:MAG: PAS domain S-box protein [Rhizobiaceae bacterium]
MLSDDAGKLLDSYPEACAVVDPSGHIVAVNRAWVEFCAANDGAPSSYIGSNYFGVCEAATGDGVAMARPVAAGIRAVHAGTPEYRSEYPCHSPTERRWFELIVRPYESDKIKYALVLHRNVTARRIIQDEIAAARASADEMAALVATSTDAIISFDLSGRILSWNRAATEMYGYSPGEITGCSIEQLHPSDWPMTVGEYVDDIIAGDLVHFEMAGVTKSGVRKDIAVSAAPIRTADGEVVAISNIHRDITQDKRNAEHQRFITQELSHRTKNLLTVISAIERQTAAKATSIDEFHEQFSARISALLASHNLLVAADWEPVLFSDLARQQLEAFVGQGAHNVTIEGPAVRLNAELVQLVGMCFHELATNAAKYGVLRDTAGHLELRWRVGDQNGGQELLIEWTESGLDLPPTEAKLTGFGHAVVTKLIMQFASADVEYRVSPSGVYWSVSLPSNLFEVGDELAD